METQFLDIAIQYYLAGRCAVFAGSMPVAGNLFHHAAEMLLKYFLLKSYTAEVLQKSFGHHLVKLWRAFKELPDTGTVAQFDALVTNLDTIERLRYPNLGYTFTIEKLKGPPPFAASGAGMAGISQYNVNLEEFDEFVTALLTGRLNPEWFVRRLRTDDAKAQYERENLHIFTK